MNKTAFDRKQFLKISASATGGLMVSFLLPGFKTFTSSDTNPISLNAYIEITPENLVRIMAPVPEMGQGTKTSLPMIIAEELGADWNQIEVIQASASSALGGQTAAGSDSIRDYWTPLREAGAGVRELLVAAAANRWNLKKEQCFTKDSKVFASNSDRVATFGELAEAAATFQIPDELTFKSKSDYTIIGKIQSRVDNLDIVTGKSKFGYDINEGEIFYAAVAHSPTFTGEVASVNNSRAMAVEGVMETANISGLSISPGSPLVLNGVAVLARNSWAAMKGRDALEIEWNAGEGSNENWDSLKNKLMTATSSEAEFILREEGSESDAYDASEKKIDLEFTNPLLGHACMEPINCTAQVSENSCEVWAPTQNPQFIKRVLSAVLQMESDQVTVNVIKSGGGFGRRLAIDYAVESVLVSRAFGGKKVKLIWTREDNVKHDFYRTASHHRVRVGIKDNKPVSWFHHLSTRPIGNGPIYEVQGAADLPYLIANKKIGYTPVESNIRIGSWRSVAHTFNTFVTNSALDQAAIECSKDPLQFHLDLLGNQGMIHTELPLRGYRGNVPCDTDRLKNVINTAAEISGWFNRKPSQNEGWGFACSYYKEGYAAHIVKLTVNSNRRIKVNQVFAVMDCGLVIDPSGLEAQMEGAIMDGISITFLNEITFQNGVVQQNNFNDLPWTRMGNAPEMIIKTIDSTENPAGAGEPPLPSVAPAITNAIYQITGERHTNLPLKNYQLI